MQTKNYTVKFKCDFNVAIACNKTLNINAKAICMHGFEATYVAIQLEVHKPGIRNTASVYYVAWLCRD